MEHQQFYVALCGTNGMVDLVLFWRSIRTSTIKTMGGGVLNLSITCYILKRSTV